jgi:hypothetical protein
MDNIQIEYIDGRKIFYIDVGDLDPVLIKKYIIEIANKNR